MYSDVAKTMGISEAEAKVFVMEHQARVSEKLRHQHGLIVDHGLGSGKTITAINAAEEYGGAVVVGPASLRGNFEKELKKYGAKGEYEIYSYESFVSEQPSLKGKMLICDEAHRLRNPNAIRTKAVEAAALESEKVLLLTATPIQNKPHDIAPLVNIAAGKEVLPTTESGFNQQFIDRKTVKPNLFDRVFRRVPVYQVKQPKNMDKFEAKTSRYIDHYMPTKEGYPRVEEHSVQIEMSKEQVQQHRAWARGAGANLRLKMERGIPLTQEEASKMNVFINAQRQVANTDRSRESPKITAIAERIKAVEGRPSVVYSNYIGSGVEQMEKALDQRGLTHASFTGKLNDSDRKRIVEDYNSGKLNVLIISSSGGEGLDPKKTAQVHVMEPHWNAEKINQVTGRAIRYKSHDGLSPEEQRVEVYRYISTIPNSNGREKSADQYLAELSQQKGELVDSFTNTWRRHHRDILDLLTEDDWDTSKHPRDERGRFASKAGGHLMRGLGAETHSPVSGNVVVGDAGSLVEAGKTYTERFNDDPKFAAYSDRMATSREKLAAIKPLLAKQQSEGITITAAQVSEVNKLEAEYFDEYQRFHPLVVQKMKGLRSELKNDSPIPRKRAEEIINGKKLETVPKDFAATRKFKEDLTEFSQISGSDLQTMDIAVVGLQTEGRSYADPWGTRSLVISGSTFNKSTVFHEASHHVECQNPGLVKASSEWVRSRSDGSGEHELSKIADPTYGPGEKAYRGNYINPYVGKIYRDGNKDIATETLSVGMQFFDSPENMATLYALDPGHFNYTVGAIRPGGRTRKDSMTAHSDLIRYLQNRLDFDPGLHPRDNKGRFSRRAGDRGMGVWYEGRRTGILVRARNKAEAKELADKKKKQGGKAAVIRELTEEEERIAQKGRWVRTGPNGEKPGQLKIRGLGPRPKNYEGD